MTKRIMDRQKARQRELRDDEKFPERQFLKSIKSRSKLKNLPCDLTLEDVKQLLQVKVCPILGIPLTKSSTGYQSNNSPSIDRIDNNLGYLKTNVRCISFRANNLKKDATAEEIVAIAMDIVRIEMEKENASKEAFVTITSSDPDEQS
jgi:hypothetical protein